MGKIAYAGSFAVIWTLSVAQFTARALARASPGATLFSIPFWLAGGIYAQQSIFEPSLGYELRIGQYAFSGRALLPGGRTLREVSGATEELERAFIAKIAEDSDVECVVLQLRRGPDWQLGKGLEPHVLYYLVDEIREQLRSMAKLSDALPSPADEDWLD
jgi:hypothetical protein